MKTNRMEITMQWGDCDPAVIAFYPRYFRWLDGATMELFDAVGLNPATLFRDHGVTGIPILDARAQFRRPSRATSCAPGSLPTRAIPAASAPCRCRPRCVRASRRGAERRQCAACLARAIGSRSRCGKALRIEIAHAPDRRLRAAVRDRARRAVHGPAGVLPRRDGGGRGRACGLDEAALPGPGDGRADLLLPGLRRAHAAPHHPGR